MIDHPTLVSLDELAKQLWVERGAGHGRDKEDWYRAEAIAIAKARKSIELLAYQLWEFQGRPPTSGLDNWMKAERILLWEQWARTKLRPYLALESKRAHETEADQLESLFSCKMTSAAGFLVVLDGAPEYSRYWHRPPEGVAAPPDPEYRVEIKDAAFYRTCLEVLEYYGGIIVDKKDSAASEPCQRRRFQDACAAVFIDDNPVHHALVAAFRLRRSLKRFNEEFQLPWTERLHARIGIGGNWSAAIRCIPHACRDEIVVSAQSFKTFDSDPRHRHLLVAAGIKIGPHEERL